MASAVLLLEDHPIYRDALRRIVESTEEFRVVAALGAARELRGWAGDAPALALVDLFLPDGDGVECLRELRRRWPAIGSVVLTAYADEWNLERAREAGAVGFLEKTAAPDAVLGALRAAAAGRSAFPRARAAAPAEAGLGEYSARTRLHRLSPRERDVARLVAAGCSNAQIAETLFISPGTVKIHVSRLYEKLGLRDRSKAVVYLLEHKSLLE